MESMVESMVESLSVSWTPFVERGLNAVVTLETTCSSAKTLGMEDRYPTKLLHTRRTSRSVAGSETDPVTACGTGVCRGGARGGVCDGKDGGTELACSAGWGIEVCDAWPPGWGAGACDGGGGVAEAAGVAGMIFGISTLRDKAV